MFSTSLEVGFLLGTNFSEGTSIYGGSSDTDSYHLRFGVSYMYSPNIEVGGIYEMVRNEAEFSSNNDRTLKLSDSAIKIGASFAF